MNLKETFAQICSGSAKNQQLIQSLWFEIETKYAKKNRYYHNLKHLECMFSELDNVKNYISNFTNISFSVFYHDIMYDATSGFNEEKSAELAKDRLQQIGLDDISIHIVFRQIIATKAHQKSDDNDTNYLIDADLSILGKDSETYLEYSEKIRKEYSMYPDQLYKPGRKKVLHNFLQLESIFKTEYFKTKYEKQARENIAFELNRLEQPQ